MAPRKCNSHPRTQIPHHTTPNNRTDIFQIAAHINGEVDKEIHTYQGGMADHVGQVFFAEEILEAAAADAPYSTNKVVRLRNVEDGIFLQENTGYCWMEWTVSLK